MLSAPHTMRISLTFLVLGLLFSACSFSRVASNLTSDIFKAGSPVFEEESDIEVAEQSALAVIKTLEAFHRHNPENETYLFLLSKSYGTYAFGFLETRMLEYQDRDPAKYQVYLERARLFYSRGRDYGLKWIARRDKKLREAIDKDLKTLQERLASYDKKEIEPVFWTALSWSSYINLTKDSVRSITDLAIVETMMGKVLQVNPDYFYGGPHLFYGAYYTSRPPMLGGDPEKGRQHFEEAVKVTQEKFLLPLVMEAQYLAVQIQDPVLFHSLLDRVEAGSIDAMPEQRLANVLAKYRAKLLRENEKRYF